MVSEMPQSSAWILTGAVYVAKDLEWECMCFPSTFNVLQAAWSENDA